jgi:hypothetical protein
MPVSSHSPITEYNPVRYALVGHPLNEQCDGSMIETDQREQLCELLITAASNAGLVSTQYDITEKWRDW